MKREPPGGQPGGGANPTGAHAKPTASYPQDQLQERDAELRAAIAQLVITAAATGGAIGSALTLFGCHWACTP
jgi:hypothetical protein